MAEYLGSDGRTYSLGKEIGSGGEGIVYDLVGIDGRVAKIFKERMLERDLKVAALAKLPWPDEVLEYLVLPRAALYDKDDHSVLRGFIMEKSDCRNSLADVYSESHPLSIYKKACVGVNLCKAVKAVHEAGRGSVVIGDFNSKNILVDRSSGKIKIIDTDSLHLKVKIKGHQMEYPCRALDPLLYMPEILRKFAAQSARTLSELEGATFSKYTDYYCLAYHIHILLTTQKPFGAALTKEDIEKSRPAPTQNSMSAMGEYVYVNRHAGTLLPRFYPDFNILTPTLQRLFTRAFRDGAKDPSLRPGPDEFLPALEEYIEGLRFVPCKGFDHYLYEKYRCNTCEWCRIEEVKKQNRKPKEEDLPWMTNGELLHYAKIDPPMSGYAYYELIKRHLGIAKEGIVAGEDLNAANTYLDKCQEATDRYASPSDRRKIRELLQQLNTF